MPFEEPLAFKVEWFDATSGLHRQFNLSFYESDKSVEMFDIKSKKMFLRRCAAVSAFDKKDLFVGNTIVVFARHLLIKGYTNDYTRQKIENDTQTTLILIYPEAHNQLGQIIGCFDRAGYSLCRVRSMRFTGISAREFLDRFYIQGMDIKDEILRLAHPDHPSIALEIVGPSVIHKWRSSIRPSVDFESHDDFEAKELSFRGIYGSPNPKDAEWELQFIFSQKPVHVQPEPPVKLPNIRNMSCCVIKPHALRQAKTGQIIEEIQVRGFDILGIQDFILSKKEAEDFYEIYKGISNRDYAGLVKQGSSGRCLVLALGQGPDMILTEELPSVVDAFRKVCGSAAEPEVCRVLYPDSLRAKYGEMSQEENAVHCSDLVEDGPLEVEYFFTLMQPYQTL